MMQSAELKDIILQWYESISTGGNPASVVNLFSRQEGFLAIGTDPAEWWQGSEQIINGYKAMANAGTYKIKVGDLEAFCESTVGWAADRVLYALPNGNEVPVRHTFVLHKENGEWKIVHVHYSIGVSNKEIGYEPA